MKRESAAGYTLEAWTQSFEPVDVEQRVNPIESGRAKARSSRGISEVSKQTAAYLLSQQLWQRLDVPTETDEFALPRGLMAASSQRQVDPS